MSRERRFLVAELGDVVELEGDEAHHLLRVLRLREGDEVVLFDGRGSAARGVVTDTGRRRVRVEVRGEAPTGESPLPLTLGVAVPKGDRMALVVQKLTELGVARIVPLVTERGEVSRERIEGSIERWARIAVEACKQSGRSLVPEIDAPRTIEDLLERVPSGGWVVAARPGAAPLGLGRERGPVLALVGPEGGWSDAEIALFERHRVSFFGLGPRTLRTETAAVVAAALLQSSAGDMGLASP